MNIYRYVSKHWTTEKPLQQSFSVWCEVFGEFRIFEYRKNLKKKTLSVRTRSNVVVWRLNIESTHVCMSHIYYECVLCDDTIVPVSPAYQTLITLIKRQAREPADPSHREITGGIINRGIYTVAWPSSPRPGGGLARVAAAGIFLIIDNRCGVHMTLKY